MLLALERELTKSCEETIDGDHDAAVSLLFRARSQEEDVSQQQRAFDMWFLQALSPPCPVAKRFGEHEESLPAEHTMDYGLFWPVVAMSFPGPRVEMVGVYS